MPVTRILLVDDEEQILEEYQAVLSDFRLNKNEQLSRLETKLFGAPATSATEGKFDIVLCRQGEEAVRKVRAAEQSGEPFALAVVDVRMPPGMNGVQAAQKMRRIDPNLYIVVATGYSDISQQEIAERVPPPEKFFYFRKPITAERLRNVAIALARKWRAETDLSDHESLSSKNAEGT